MKPLNFGFRRNQEFSDAHHDGASEIIRYWKTLLVAVVALGVMGSVSANDLDGTWKPTAVGTKVVYDDGSSFEVIRVDGNEVFFKGNRSADVTDVEWMAYMGMYDNMSNSDGSEWFFSKEAIERLYPLEVGNESTVPVNDGRWHWETTFKVTKIKEIETPLGPRQTFVIKYNVKGVADLDYSGQGYGYYDPELSIWYEGAYKSKGSARVDWKATSVELPQ